MTETPEQPDVIIIGSGPAGVSAAWPLLEAGLSVLMLDQGKTGLKGINPSDPRTLYEIRTQDDDQWKRFLGEDYSALTPRGMVSPKLKVPAQQFVFEDFHSAYGLKTENFQAVGSLAQGGLSNAWGAGAYVYDDEDLKEFPISRSDIAASAAAVAKRIGLSGALDDDMAAFYGNDVPVQPGVKLDPKAEKLLQKYETSKKESKNKTFLLGRARNAVLTEPLGNRDACAYDDMCLWGCSRGAVYNAAQEIGPLKKHQLFSYQPNVFVSSIDRTNGVHEVVVRCDGHTTKIYRSKTLVLAAGTIGSTALAFRHLGYIDKEIPLYSNPTVAVPLVVPGALGGELPKSNFALGQLGFQLRTPELSDAYAHGVLFAASGLPASEFIRHIPLSRPAAIRLFRALQPALLIANCFLPGHLSKNRFKITSQNGADGTDITGGNVPDLARIIKSTAREMSLQFRKLGAYALPGSARSSEPGADIHYAGTLPMRADVSPGDATPHTSVHGELSGCDGLYVVDGSVLNHVSAKNPTFTIMANADRISRNIAGRLKA